MTGDDHAPRRHHRAVPAVRGRQPGRLLGRGLAVRARDLLRLPGTPITDAEASPSRADGFEIALHLNTGCQNFTRDRSPTPGRTQLPTSRPPGPASTAPGPTGRTASPGATGRASRRPSRATASGSTRTTTTGRSTWVNDRPGMFTGSGFPMRFADERRLADRRLPGGDPDDRRVGIDIPTHIKALLDGALGADGYYGVFTANMHTDEPVHAGRRRDRRRGAARAASRSCPPRRCSTGSTAATTRRSENSPSAAGACASRSSGAAPARVDCRRCSRSPAPPARCRSHARRRGFTSSIQTVKGIDTRSSTPLPVTTRRPTAPRRRRPPSRPTPRSPSSP